MKFKKEPRAVAPFGEIFGARDLRVARRFGENLARCRERAGFSVPDLAARSRLGASEVELLEGGRTPLSAEALLKLSASLSVPSGELLAGVSWAPESGRFEVVEGTN